MLLTLLKAKIHRATVTDANLNYEGSISIDPALYQAAGIVPFEKVDIYNCNNGARIATYVIEGKPGEVCLNGAAARHALPGDKVIIAAYCQLHSDEVAEHEPRLVFVGDRNRIVEK